MKKPAWQRCTLSLPGNNHVEAIAPLIISASRATDIPAQCPEWLVTRFKEGYTVWKNPFNGRSQYIALHAVRIIAFWSKNPAPLIPHLDFFTSRDIGFIFHCTVNDYEHEGFEPGIPALPVRIRTVKKLAALFGKNNVIWRFDPILITPELTPEVILKRIEHVGDQIAEHVNRLTISFLSHYPKVIRRMRNSNVHPKERMDEHLAIVGEGLRRLSQRWKLPVVTCAEPSDLSAYGIAAGRCIDPQHLLSTFPDDAEITALVHGQMSTSLFPLSNARCKELKDPGQRKLCGCMISKDIGRYGTCRLGCLYCYAR